jgi:hypothetical protein
VEERVLVGGRRPGPGDGVVFDEATVAVGSGGCRRGLGRKVGQSGSLATEGVRGGAARSARWRTPSSGGTARRGLRSRPCQDHAVLVRSALGLSSRKPGPSVAEKPKLEVRRQAKLHPAVRRRKTTRARAHIVRAGGSRQMQAERRSRRREAAGPERSRGCRRESGGMQGARVVSRLQKSERRIFLEAMSKAGRPVGDEAQRWPGSSPQPLTRREQLGAGERVRDSAARAIDERNAACPAPGVARSREAGRTDGRRPGSSSARRPNPAASKASLARRDPAPRLRDGCGGSPPRAMLGRIQRGTGTEPGDLGSVGRQRASEVSLFWSGFPSRWAREVGGSQQVLRGRRSAPGAGSRSSHG